MFSKSLPSFDSIFHIQKNLIRKRLRQCAETQNLSRETPLREAIAEVLRKTFDYGPRMPTQLCQYASDRKMVMVIIIIILLWFGLVCFVVLPFVLFDCFCFIGERG
jgi:hypothetical protein